MDRLLSVEPSKQVAVRVEPGQKCSGELTLRNVMHTMPVAFRLQPVNPARYSALPQSGIIGPLATVTVEITYILPPGSPLPEYSAASSDNSFLLHSVVAPGAAVTAALPNDLFTARKKQVFIDSGIRAFFVGSAVLTRLVAEGEMEKAREVLERSDPARRAADSVDALHLAIAGRRADLVQLLLEFEADVEARRLPGTPLEAAAAAGDALVVELLLARRASTERGKESAWGAIHHAAAGGHLEVMRLLLLKGAVVDEQASDGRTALHLAAGEKRRECARLLLTSGARAAVVGGGEVGTPLHVAAAAGDEKMVRLLLSRGGAGIREVRDRAGRTAYDLATEGGHVRLFDALRLGEKLCGAARKGETRAAGRLIDRGAAVNGRDQNGWTALMRAGFKGRVDLIRALLNKGAEVDAQDEEGYTALHCAVEAGHAEAVEMLVKRGADVEARTAKGATAMQIAGSLGYPGISRILTQGGAPPPVAAVPAGVEKLEGGKYRVFEGDLKKGSKLGCSGGNGEGDGRMMKIDGLDGAACAVVCSH